MLFEETTHKMDVLKEELFNNLRKYDALREGDKIKLKSGQETKVYFDVKKALGYPHVRRLAAQILKEKMVLRSFEDKVIQGFEENPYSVDFVAGRGHGGIPLATELSRECFLPLTTIREGPKGYGPDPDSFLEGYIPQKSNRGVLVDDVINTGNSTKDSMKMLENKGATVAYILGVLNRIPERNSIDGHPLYCITTNEDFLKFMK